eukprot:127916_1
MTTEETGSPPVVVLESGSLDDGHPELAKRAEDITIDNHSISQRRERKVTDLFFDQIVGTKLKCYEKWKIWAALCAIATAIAITATIIATVFAVEHAASFKTKSEAITAQNTMIEELFESNSSNETDHSNEVRRIFNTFDDNNDGLWDIHEFADHLNRATEREATFNRMDLDNDDILSFSEVIFAKSQEPPVFSSLFSHERIEDYYNYTGPKNDSLYWQYQANIFFNMYGAGEKGYITRDVYYQSHAEHTFNNVDLDSNEFIDFDEFSANAVDMNVIEWFKSPLISQYINQMLLQPFDEYNHTQQNEPINANHKTCVPPSQIPFNSTQNRRRMRGDHYDFMWEQPTGNIRYIIECDMKYAVCQDIGHSASECIEYKMLEVKQNQIFKCLASVYECIGSFYFNFCLGDEEAAAERCDCYCVDTTRRRRSLLKNDKKCEVASCDDSSCFAGDNIISIKRNDQLQNAFIKDVKVGDYVRSKYGGWTKIWWVKKLQRNTGIGHLKLYFGEDEHLTLTHNHLLYVNVLDDEYTKTAREVSVGDVLFVHDMESDSFVEKKVIDIGYATEGVTYGPSTMDGTIVVSNVVASAYEGSYEIAKEIHRMTAMVRFISEYISQDLAVIVTDLNFYYVFDPLQRYNLGYIIFNSYSTPFITIATIGAPIMISMKIIRHLS